MAQERSSSASKIMDRVLSLNDREDIARLCADLRLTAAGGQQAVDDRRLKAGITAKSAQEAFEDHRLKEAFTGFSQAALIIGDYSDESVMEGIVKSALALRLLEDAVAYAFIGRIRFGGRSKFFVETMAEIYAGHGYKNMAILLLAKSGSDPKKISSYENSRDFDDVDLAQFLNRFLSLDFSHSSTRNLYVLVHIALHCELRGQKADFVIRNKSDFLTRIAGNEKFVNFLTKKANFVQLNLVELHFVQEFFKLVKKWTEQSDDFDGRYRAVLTSCWGYPFLKRFAASLITDQALAKFAKFQPAEGTYQELFSLWVGLSDSAFLPKAQRDFTAPPDVLFEPFDNFTWYGRITRFFMFEDWEKALKIGERDIEAVKLLRNMSAFLSGGFLPAAMRRDFIEKIERLPRDQLTETIELLVLQGAVSFAYSKWLLLKGSPGIDETGMTDSTTKVLFLSATWWEFLYKRLPLETSPLRNFFLNQTYLFVHLAKRVEFVVKNFRNLNEDGRTQLTRVVYAMAMPICAAKSATELSTIANCQEFTKRVLPPFAKILKRKFDNEWDTGDRELVLRCVPKMVAILTSQEPSILAKYLTSKKIISLITSAKRLKNYHLLAVLLRNIREADRTVLASSQLAPEIAVHLFTVAMRSDASNDVYANVLICLNSMLTPAGSPPIISLDRLADILRMVDELGVSKNSLVLKLTSLMRGMPQSLSGLLASLYSAPSTPLDLYPTFGTIASVYAGILLATLVKSGYLTKDNLRKGRAALLATMRENVEHLAQLRLEEEKDEE